MTPSPPRTAIIAGASSGVGAATARALGHAGVDVALVARREDHLRALAREVEAAGRRAVPIGADLRDPEAAGEAMRRALDALGGVDALVCCLGTNVPHRRLSALTTSDWDSILATNLSSIYYCVRAVLPAMRARGGGMIVSISSIAGRWPSALSGAAYSASKAGLDALSRCINLEEGGAGIRSCVILPGDIDTELLDLRPEPPASAARAAMLRPEDVAALVVSALSQPASAWVDELVVRPRGAP